MYMNRHEDESCHVLVRALDDYVTVWLTDTYCRYFTKNELPDYIKQRIAMVSVVHTNYPRDRIEYKDSPNEALTISAYTDSKDSAPPELAGIGWRVNDKYYYIVITGDEYKTLASKDGLVSEATA
jgi:hypothetical protein